MIKLKVKCSICGKEESSKELIREVSCTIMKYNLKSEHYLSLLNLMSGKCLDSDEHSFIFDEAFLKEIDDIANKHKENLAEIEKLNNENRTLIKEIRDFEIKIQELKLKENSNHQKIETLRETESSYGRELIDSTGNSIIEMWY